MILLHLQLKEVEQDEGMVRSLLFGLEGSAPGKAGVAGKHDISAKSKAYGTYSTDRLHCSIFFAGS